jgi:ABC-type sugar transport system substrate-binding protein
MKENYPEVEIVARPTHWQGPEAADATQSVLAAQDIDGIYMQTDCGHLTPVTSVMRQDGKLLKVGEDGHIILGGIDGCPPALEAIKEGTLDFTVEQPLFDYGQRVVYLLDGAV